MTRASRRLALLRELSTARRAGANDRALELRAKLVQLDHFHGYDPGMYYSNRSGGFGRARQYPPMVTGQRFDQPRRRA